MSEIALDSAALFKRLVDKIKGKPEYQQRVVAHIREVSGHATLPSFHANGTPEQKKFEIYGTCLAAIIKAEKKEADPWAKLNGQVPIGQAAVPVEAKPEPTIEEEHEEKPEPVNRVEKIEKPAKRIVEPVADTGDKDNALASLARALSPLMGSQKQGVDEQDVRVIIDEQLKDHIANVNEVLSGIKQAAPDADAITKIVDEACAKALAGAVIHVEIHNRNETKKIDGLAHWQFPQMLTWISAGIPVWAWGGGGSGKTHMPRQIAAALGIRYKVVSIDPTITVGKLLGFRNMATGDFVKGFIYEFYKEGGLIALDECATGDQGIISALNALIANDEYTFPNDEVVQKHENFRVLAMDNTKGSGAVAGYTARNRLDAATLDRFAIIEVEYDEALERALATGKPLVNQKRWENGSPANDEAIDRWVTWVQGVRSQVGKSVLVSPRASIMGARALRAGVTAKEVVDSLVFKLASDDTKANIISSCGEFRV